MNIQNILKPKSEDSIIKAICQKYDIEITDSRDVQIILDLLYMTNIIDIKISMYFSKITTAVSKEIGGIPTLSISYDAFSPDKNKDIELILSSWTEIFDKFMCEILKIATAPPKLKLTDLDDPISDRDRCSVLHVASYIAITTRFGPANFIIIPKDKKLELEGVNELKIITTDKIQNKIVIGRKNHFNGGVLDPGIVILRDKDKYAIFTVPDSEKNYFYINYKI